MIESLFTETFKILRRQADTEDSWNENQQEILSDLPCLVLSRSSEIDVRTEAMGVSNRLALFTTTEVQESDEIIYDGVIYHIGIDGLSKRKNALTGTTYYYRVFLEEGRPYLETEVEIKEV